MNKEQIQDHIGQINPDALLAGGFEDAFIGTVTQFNKTLACYDRQKCIDILVKRDGMDHDEAEEFFEFNCVGAYVGENTPCFFERFDSCN